MKEDCKKYLRAFYYWIRCKVGHPVGEYDIVPVPSILFKGVILGYLDGIKCRFCRMLHVM